MNMKWFGALVVFLLLTATPSLAAESAEELAARAQGLLERGSYAEAAKAFEAYIKAHPQGKAIFSALVGAFNAHVKSDNASLAQKAGKRLFKRYPDSKGTFPVLVTWIGKKWKVPTLATSYKVLHYWTFDRVDASRNPDLRLAFLDLIAKYHPREEIVKAGGILFCQAWCHMTSGRQEEAIKLGQKYLRSKPRGDYVDRTRMVVAQAMLDLRPPKTAEAMKLLRILAADDKSSQQARAKDLLASAGAGPPSIQINEGFPTAEGLGKMVVLTNLPAGHVRRKALNRWMEARKAEVVSFRGRDVLATAGRLRKHGAEYVAVVVEPRDVDNNFQLMMLELCRDLDKDPMPDFHFGYLVTRDPADLEALTTRILEKEKAGGTVAREVGVPTSGGAIEGLDFFIHYGHGTARGIVKGLSASQVAELTLPRGPVIISGACFNGVCARTHERFIMGNHHGKPDELKPKEVLSLAWIHAGATGLFAALDGDRGEMAGAEWEHFREYAPPLGDVMGYQYRLIFTSLRESFESFPRYKPGTRKNKSFYGVMLRGQTSRILISDPMYRPLHSPLGKPTTKTVLTHDPDAKTMTVRVEMLKRTNGPFVNTLPTKAGTPFQETRLYTRVALPEGFEGTLGFPKADAKTIKLTKVQAKHEIWGGRRYVNLQAESGDWSLTKAGSVTTYEFKVVR